MLLGVLLLGTLLRTCFANVGRILQRNVAAHQSGYGGIVDAVHHLVEEFHTFQLEDEQRVFLLVASILYRLLEFVKLAQVFFPSIVYVVKEDGFFKVAHHGTAFALVGFLQVGADVVNQLSIRNGHKNVFVLLTLLFVNIADNGHGHFGKSLDATAETIHRSLECLLVEVFATLAVELLLCERHFDGHDVEELATAVLIIAG